MATNEEGGRVTTDKLMADFRVLAADMEQLLTETAGQSGQHVARARARAEQSLHAARARLVELQDIALAKTRAAGRATDEYVHANPWQVIAACAVAGVLIGALLTRGATADE
jgi:ElaB/YqjD/DUF883 family membrane-anchored ribosome-binding protein